MEIENENKSPSHNIKKYKKKYCNNCGNHGHHYRNCKYPITSYGIVCFKINGLNEKQPLTNDKIQYLLIRRRNSISYVEFLRGKYRFIDLEFISTLFSRMSENERNTISNANFDEIWKNLWIGDNLEKNTIEYNRVKKKYMQLKNGLLIEDKFITLDNILQNTTSIYIEPEWCFPKGRRNCFETDLECSEREFQEETNYIKQDYELYDDILPFTEQHVGSNNITYRTIYYLAQSSKNKVPSIDKNNKLQCREISSIGFYNYDTIVNKLFRDYDIEKKKNIKNIHKKILDKFNENI
tara:strand:- start:99 stop:983 length:885 start_codon:yes stop_codon:yes gene_type:complete